MVARQDLPEGWTIERVRAVARGDAELLPLTTPVRVREVDEWVHLTPTCVINFSGLCLVEGAEDGVWSMGEPDRDGIIFCWSGYGDDLEDAIRSL